MKTPLCKTCGKEGHYKSFCMLNRKPIKVNKPLPRPTKPIKKTGKVSKQWNKTRTQWFKDNNQEYYICYLCGKRIDRSETTLDHVIPRSRSPELRFAVDNLRPACWTCNAKKGSRVLL